MTHTEAEVQAAAGRLRDMAALAVERLGASGRSTAAQDIAAVRAYVAAVPVDEWYAVVVATARVSDLISWLGHPIPTPNLAAVLGDPPPSGLPEPWSLTYLQPRPSAEQFAGMDVLIVLDIDGVVLRQPPRPGLKHPQLEDDAGEVFDLDIVSCVVDLSDLLYRERIEFCFLSSWAAQPLDLDQLLRRFPEQSLQGGFILAGQPADGSLPQWKLDAIRALEARLPAHVALIWIDDQLRQITALDPVWAADTSRDRLLIATHAASGILPGHVRQVADFIDAHRTRV